jgi:putative nucleotidyltransferase with HDIG domain
LLYISYHISQGEVFMSQAWMERGRAVELLRAHLKNEHLVKHCLASEAIMRSIAKKLGEDEELWGLTGLLHDIDFESTKDEPSQHTIKGAKILEQRCAPENVIAAIKHHNAEALGLERQKPFHYALACAETITGMVVAAALVRPDKKLEGVKVKSIKKRMKEKAFARNVNREIILECEKLGISLEDFITLSLDAMKAIAPDLGL